MRGGGWGGLGQDIGYEYGLYSFNFHQNLKNLYLLKAVWFQLSFFETLHPSKKTMLPKANKQRKKKTICQIFHQKEIQKVLVKIEEMLDVFLN